MPRTRKRKTTRDEWGSITQTRDGLWRLRYPTPDGKRRDGGRYRTRSEAEDARAQLRTSILGGTWRATGSGESPLLADFCIGWLQRAELAGDLAPSSVALYRRQFERLVLPDVGGIELGRVPVARLSREIVMQWDVAARTLARARAAGLADRQTGAAAARRQGHPARTWARSQGVAVPKTGRLPDAVLQAWEEAGSPRPTRTSHGRGTGDRQYEQARTALSAVCTAAVEDGYLTEHPVRMRPGTKARRRRRSARRAVRIVSLDVLLAVASAMPAPYGLAALVTTFAGLRGGEVFALAGEHLEYGRDGVVEQVRVEQAVIEISGQPAMLGPPKSEAGVRSVAIPRQVGELLAEHHRSLGLQAAGVLFTTRTGTLVTTDRRSRVLATARAKVSGAEHLTWHGLRHTGLTLAATVPGTTIRNIMDRGGHSTPRAALIYQHTAANVEQHIAQGLANIIDLHRQPKRAG